MTNQGQNQTALVQVRLARRTPASITQGLFDPVDASVLPTAKQIIQDVQQRGTEALLDKAVRFDGLQNRESKYIYTPADLKQVFDALPVSQQQLLIRTEARIAAFAQAQRNSIQDVTAPVPGGEAGHTVVAVQTAGCYAPGGRYPLPSSVLMTAVTARVAGCAQVIVASPCPAQITLGAAYVAKAHMLIAVGGAQAIAAFAYGCEKTAAPNTATIPRCDVICGPGNAFVTAAKSVVSGMCGIDMLAGPSELLVIADEFADPALIAADLIAQAEHDTQARPMLVTTSEKLVQRVEHELTLQMTTLGTQDVARVACASGFAVICHSMQECIDVSNRLAPEHLEVLSRDYVSIGEQLKATGTYGGLFIGPASAEVLGDYGCGPNHTLPTAGTARYSGGLSVFNFLRIRTWLNMKESEMQGAPAQAMVQDAVDLAELEGLQGHARSARKRLHQHLEHSAQVFDSSLNSQQQQVGNGNGNNVHNAPVVNGAPHALAVGPHPTNGVSSSSSNSNGHTTATNGKVAAASASSTSPASASCPSSNPGSAAAAAALPAEIRSLLRSDIDSLPNYKPVQPLSVIATELGMQINELSKLNANENLYGPMRGMNQHLEQTANKVMHIYPDPDQIALRQALAAHLGRGVRMDQIVCGAGSDELLDLIIGLCEPGAVVTCAPTFGMYTFFSRIQKTHVIDVNRDGPEGWKINVQAIIDACNLQCNDAQGRPVRAQRIVFLASPNNPTGSLVSLSDVRTLCQQTQALIVLDEAYAEFADEHTSALSLVHEFPNLCVMRTFSKWSGLAGLRCGYAVMHTQLAIKCMQIKQPYNVNVAAEEAALFSLKHSDIILSTAVRAMLYERQRLMVELTKFHWLTPLPSSANFLLVRVDSPARECAALAPKALQAALFQRGVMVRCYAGSGEPHLDDYIRVSCGRPQDTDRLLQVLLELENKYLAAKCDQTTRLTSSLTQLRAHKLSCVLFDMDGVLADVSSSYRVAIQKTAADFNVQVTPEQITEMKNRGNANNDWILTQRLINAHRSKEQQQSQVTLEQVRRVFQAFYCGDGVAKGLRDSETLLMNIALLREIQSSGAVLGIVTGRPLVECKHFLAQHKLDSFFGDRIVSMDDPPAKPSGEPVLLALQRCGVTQGCALLIGDTVDDMRACEAAQQHLTANGLKLHVFGLGVPAPGERQSLETVRRLYECGAVHVMTSLAELRHCVLRQEFDIYDTSSSDNSNAQSNAVAAALVNTRTSSCVDLSAPRSSSRNRKTKETEIRVALNLDGTGAQNISTGIGFLDHMLSALSKHSRIDLDVQCLGDLEVDDHHTVEDVGIAIGQCVNEAVGSKVGIRRFGEAHVPLDEALARVIVDLSGRPGHEVDLKFTREMVGQVSTEMLTHFFQSFATEARLTLHVHVLHGVNNHHKAEAAFKAMARALQQAVQLTGFQDMPSTKGCL